MNADRPGPDRFPDPFATVQRLGAPRHLVGDLYHRLLKASWVWLFSLIVAVYVGTNAAFAALYLFAGDSIENARPGFLDAFFFSVQTMATIGYGKMVPHGIIGNALVTVEAFAGLVGLAVATGVIFAKLSRPTARVLFSRVAVVGPRDGVPSLMFRMANERSNRIVEAQVRVVLTRDETTLEGDAIRRFYDLALSRSQTALFALSWTAIHPITPGSPLYGETAESLAKGRAGLVVSLMGFDETLAQTIHARHTYTAADLVFDARFVDIFGQRADGTRAMDYRRFHDHEPLAANKRATDGNEHDR